VGLTPLSDATQPYQGFEASLYPDGSDVRPAAHEAGGLARAALVVPRDAFGQPDLSDGRIGVLTVGVSNTKAESDSFVALSQRDPLRSPAVRVVTGAEPGAVAETVSDPSAPYWGRVLERVASAGLTPEQVQAVWMLQANAHVTEPFPQHAATLQQHLTAIVQIVRQYFPNTELCYVSSRIYAGYATTTLSPEPIAYESAFAYRWMIEDQITGSPELNFDPARGPVRAPWLSWGPYLWADGLVPRSDGLTWECQDFADDGTHPSAIGARKVADRLLTIFRTDVTTAPWYLATSPTPVEEPPPSGGWTVQAPRPNPFGARLALPLRLAGPRRVHAAVYTAGGRLVRTLRHGLLGAGVHRLVWDGRDDAGALAPSGVYFVRLESGADTARTVKVTLVR
jgi:hypothetical protein